MRTAEELSDRLSEERIWRVKEITAVSSLASRRNLPLVETEFYCRAGSALFYAHWEGFVKRSATHYLKYVAFQRIKIAEMSDFVMCLFMRQSLGLVGVNWKNVIDTEFNLSSKALNRITAQLGLDYSLFATKAVIIDGLVVKHRNAIAHGEKGEVDLNMLNEIAEQVIGLITLFRDMIENAVITKAHMRMPIA
jgi:hypothetical protein